jgi:hypothetical protein
VQLTARGTTGSGDAPTIGAPSTRRPDIALGGRTVQRSVGLAAPAPSATPSATPSSAPSPATLKPAPVKAGDSASLPDQPAIVQRSIGPLVPIRARAAATSSPTQPSSPALATFDPPPRRPDEPLSLQGIFELAGPAQPQVEAPAQPEADPVEVQRATDPATPLPAPPRAAPGAAPGVGASHSDLEELARQLYEPLATRLRADLWLDRERAGLITGLP